MRDNFISNIQYDQKVGGNESNKITEAIILAGGLGTRLRNIIPDLPKCMAPVNGKPFIAYVLEHLYQQGIKKIILSLGYKHEMIVEYIESFQSQHKTQNLSTLTIKFSIEE